MLVPPQLVTLLEPYNTLHKQLCASAVIPVHVQTTSPSEIQRASQR